MARGRPSTPDRPAAVSGPGRLSARTDGGPAQPIRAPSGGPHGQRKELEDLQRAAPLPAAEPSIPSGAGIAPAQAPGGIFGPTQRPAEDPLRGLDAEQRALEADPTEFVRVLYQLYPHPDIARLIDPYNAP